jgi:hypothetical protein
VEQRCGEDDEQEAYRKDLRIVVRPLNTSQCIVWLCAKGRRTKDSPMIVLMPAMMRLLRAV